VLSAWFARLLPRQARILDVGCGDGQVSALLQSMRPDISIRGLDVLPRSCSHIPIEIFDGVHLPFDDGSFDWILLSDVLHHTNDVNMLLGEARRVASQGVLIKDHYRKGFAASARLRFMDWVGNARHAVALPYSYWSEMQWRMAWREIGLRPGQVVTHLGLYPRPFDWVFGAQLHFVAVLGKCRPMSPGDQTLGVSCTTGRPG
jgi:SAM-dependent methyltransferase